MYRLPRLTIGAHEVLPPQAFHELPIPAVKNARVLFGDFSGMHRAAQFGDWDSASQAHFVVVVVPASDRSLAGLSRVAPVLHVVGLGHTSGSGIPQIIMACRILHVIGR